VQELSVGEFAKYLNQVLASDVILSDVWVTGEVSGARNVRGNMYFDLIDGDVKLPCSLCKTALMRQRVTPEDGQKVSVHGYVDYYAPFGKLSLKVDVVQRQGIGLVSLELERLRMRLEAEGLFSEARKRPLPHGPKVIGIITSEQGAVLHDVRTVLERRYPMTELLLAPTRVQGEGAPESIRDAFDLLTADGRAEVIILARGGGSKEDLSAFDTEIVARAIYASPVPVVTGVGHETDTTIADMVADVRAATPSVAAELVSLDRDDILRDVARGRALIEAMMASTLAASADRLAALSDALVTFSPSEHIEWSRSNLDAQRQALSGIVMMLLSRRRGTITQATSLLDALSPLDVLARGYAVIADSVSGRTLSSVSDMVPGADVRITVADGSAAATIHGQMPGSPRGGR